MKKCKAFFGLLLLSGLFPLTPPAAAQIQRVLGLDISAWQPNISQTTWNNFQTVENRQFVLLRASRGGTTGYYNQNNPGNNNPPGQNTFSQRYDDPYFIQYINRAVTANMYAGSYHFSRPDIIASTLNSGGIPNSGTDEADHFLQMAGPWMRPGYLLPVHDFEAGSGLRSNNDMAQFCLDFSDRIYQVMGIRPAIYTSGSYASILQGASLAQRDSIAKPADLQPSVVSPAYSVLWSARWPNQANPNAIDVQNGEPKDTYSPIYGPWDDYGVTHPWVFWQYASTMRLQSFNNGGSNLDADVARGGLEFLKDYLVPAIWVHDGSGDWNTLTNWNSGQTPTLPVPGPGQVAPVGTLTLPTPRLPGAAGSGTASGQHDTVILERPNANITVTLASGTHNIRKLYQRETLDITGGSLTVNYVPSADSTTNGAQFSGPVTLSGSGSLSVHTLQVDTNQTFTLGGGTLTFDTIKLMPHSTVPATIALSGNVNFNSLANATATIVNGAGAGNSGSIDLTGASRIFNVSNGTNAVDLALDVPLANGALVKTGGGTMRLTAANTYSSGTTVSAGTLLVNNGSGSGTGSGSVAVNGGALGGMGSIAGTVTVNSGGTLSPGTPTAIGALTLDSVPVLLGTNFLKIDRNGGASLADQIILANGTLNYGGALVISNAGAALVGGEVFTNFVAPAYSGVFTTTNLPGLTAGLNWYLGNLVLDGTLQVNRSPVTHPIFFTNAPPATLQISKASLLANATDDDGNPLTLMSVNLTTTNGITLTTNGTHIFYTNAAEVADRFFYTINDGHGGSATGAVDILPSTGTYPPVITAQPVSQTFIAGNAASLNVSVTGGMPLAYQWYFNGSILPGATGSAFSTSNIQPPQAGDYFVRVTNVFGVVTSDVATVTVHYSLTATATAGGTVSASPAQASYAPNTLVTLTATAQAGFVFTGWTGDASGTTHPLDVTLNTNQSITANFAVSTTDLVLDNTNSAVTFSSNWQTGTGSGKYGANYRFASTAVGGMSNVIYRPTISVPGYYHVYIWYPQGSNRATNAPWMISYDGGSTNVPVNQTINGASWFLLASARPFVAGTNGFVLLSNDSVQTGKVVMADAVRLVYVGPLLTPPTITAQPENQTINQGETANFSITASGSAPLNYQWRRNGVDLTNDARLAGTTTAALTIANVSPGDAGNYTVIVTNSAGADTSSAATLSVNTPPSITVPLQGQTNNLGATVNFTISASGSDPLTFHWKKSGVALADDGHISGADSAALTVDNLTLADEGNYSVIVSNEVGFADSGSVFLRVLSPPVISTPPASQTNAAGATVNFTISTSGRAPLIYQWKKNGGNLSNGSQIAGATTAALTLGPITALDAGNYSVAITNADGGIESPAATLTIGSPPVITLPPASQTVNLAHPASFTVTASGATPFGYQWRFNGTNISGATTSAYSINGVQPAHVGHYSVVVSNAFGSTLSANAWLGVKTDFGLPTVKITFPTSSQRLLDDVLVTNYVTTMRGTAADNVGLAKVQFTINGSGWQTAVGTTNWTADLTLLPGLNTVVVKSTDTATNDSVLLTRSFTFVVTSPLTVHLLGSGQVASNWSGSPLLEIGKTYKLTATVGAGTNSIFTNWTRVLSGATNHFAATNVLNFVMQSNLVLQANFITNPFVRAAGLYSGLFYEDSEVRHHSSGFFSIKPTAKLGYSGKLLLDGNAVTFSGKFNLPGTATKTISRAKLGKSDLTLTMALDFTTWSDQITGTVQDGTNWTADLLADRAVWTTNAGGQATLYTNSYTMALPGFADANDGPPGWSHSGVSVDALGKVKLNGGYLADGQRLSQGTVLSQNGQWPLYVGLYPQPRVFTYNSVLKTNVEHRGSVLGWIQLATNTPAGQTHLAPQGSVSWIKTGWTNALYPGGFTNLADLIGSRHLLPPAGTPVLNWTVGAVVLREGNLNDSFTNLVVLKTNNTFTIALPVVNGLKTTLTPKTGAWQGSFTNAPGQPATKFYGAILQDYLRGYGWFAGTNQTGTATLTP